MSLGMKKYPPRTERSPSGTQEEIENLRRAVSERDAEIERLSAEVESESDRIRHDYYIAWAKSLMRTPGIPDVMLLGFEGLPGARSTKSVMQRGYVRVSPRTNDAVYIHDNGEQYVKLPTAEGQLSIEVLEAKLHDQSGRSMFFLEGTYTEEEAT
jgi:hypothetical protein